MKKLVIALTLFSLLWSCKAKPVYFRPALEKEGEVYLYIKPFPQEAERLRFDLKEVYAINRNGTEYPLSLALSEFSASAIRRQRLVASGHLPQGSYSGFSFRVTTAHLKVKEGEAALLVPDEPTVADFAFHIRRKEALLLSLNFQYAGSIRQRFDFKPNFSVFKPDRPITGLVGYVSNYDSNNITVFNKISFQAVAVIATGRGPKGLAIDENLRKAYVALSKEDAVDVIDMQAGRTINRIRLNTDDNPQEIALTQDGRLLLTANKGSDTVSMIDPFSLIETGRINVGDGPDSVLIDRRGRRAYVFNIFSSTISVIDLATRAVVGTVSTELEPLRGQFNRRGDRLYVIHKGSPYMTVIDPASLSVIDRVFVGMGASSIKIDTITDSVYVGKAEKSAVEIYNPFSSTPVDFIKTARGTTYMAIDDEKNNLYLVTPGSRTITAINLISKRTVSEIDVGEGPYWVALMGER